MCASTRGLGIPDFGEGLPRERLFDLLRSMGNRSTVLVAPSGSGKSFLVSQFLRQQNIAAVWIDAGGSGLEARELRDSILAALRGRQARSHRHNSAESSPADCAATVADAIDHQGESAFCLVVDDYGIPTTAGEIDGLAAISKALWSTGVRTIVTTRSIEAWPSEMRCGWVVVDEHDLALLGSEARALAARSGVDDSAVELEELRTEVDGHMALFLAMLSQLRRYGLSSTGNRSASLEAWLDRVVGDMSPSDFQVFRYACALKTGSDKELLQLGVTAPRATLQRLKAVLPLISFSEQSSGEFSFTVHDLVDAYAAECLPEEESVIESAVELLTEHGRYGRACELLTRLRNPQAALDWLSVSGEAAYLQGNVAALARLIDGLPMSFVMVDARLLVLWSQVCFQTGRYDESLAKAKAARLLAEHDKDFEAVCSAIAQSLSTLRLLGRLEEAVTLAESVADSQANYVDDTLLAEALFCIGVGRITRGDADGGEGPLRAATELVTGNPNAGDILLRIRNTLAASHVVNTGDYQAARVEVVALVDDASASPMMRVMLRGNLALCLAECGRFERAETLLRSVLRDSERYGLDVFSGAYLPVLGMIRVAASDSAGGMANIRAGISASLKANDVGEAAINRIYLALALRALGQIEDSLTEAEQALEVLSIQDQMGYRQIAALEVAGSLLAGGDQQAARTWVESHYVVGQSNNDQLNLRAAMILAECLRRDGDYQGASQKLVPFRSYIKSENPNMLVAMYSRAFPALLGLFAIALGPESLPAHMLRMIPPESSERILVETHPWLESDTWRALGIRLLGDEEFAKFLARDGLPVCHVHFFGGLEVSVGGRSVREKDWRKRKARLLFAMLVLRRGQDVPRDLLFEYLFPEMDPERAKNNLYVVWSTMKSVLMGEGAKGAAFPYFEAVGGVCRAVRENIRCDVDDFDKLLAKAKDHEAAGELGKALQYYERLSSLYRGELLPGDVYDDWFAELREHYKITFVDAMLSASGILMNADDPGNALVYARRAIQTDSLREDLYQVALRCQIAAGQRSGAIDTYLQCRSRLAEDLGLDPSAETRSLYEQILAMEDKPRIIPLDPLVD